MAKLWFKFQRYFRRKPVRFFTFLALYLTAGSLVFLHSGFVGQPAVSGNQANPVAAGGPAEGAELPFLGDMHLGRGFRDTGEASSIARRYGPWFKGKDGNERAKLGDYGGAWSRALKGRVVREKEEERDGSAVFRGCFRKPDNLSLALPMTAAMLNMSVDKCVDFCTEK
ncbi:hypothetical protein CR201_G0056210, partial [Pongo abelii]